MAKDPIKQFRRWYGQAQRAGVPKAEAMALATADESGRPSVRLVLLKQADDRGFVFYTNAHSRKGRELRANPRAALAFHWNPLGRQVRIEGAIEEVSTADVEAYWRIRPRESQLAALASHQSAPLASRAALLALWKRLAHEYQAADIPRPAEWIGFRVLPDAIEFWTHRDHRLHERELFVRTRRGWKRTLLQP